ncbi:Hypothetical predicted protein [Mytilus galloprovincialis]|uniref:F-box domain-containing protein n=1 Tax=Mytilus galloprovincialis TaxID=29158 RepID=A0A8B6HJR5_MYTGA|nr:Hypothetical predicted protein [Mytilus galloprovincialis]
MFTILDLPTTTVIHITDFLNWEEKFDLAWAIPAWKDLFNSTKVWKYIELDCGELKSKVDIKRSIHKFVSCMVKYGRNVKNLKLYFYKENLEDILHVLEAACTSCWNLNYLGIGYMPFRNISEPTQNFTKSFSSFLCNLLAKCADLNSVDISSFKPSMDNDEGLSTLLSIIQDQHVGHKISGIDFLLISPYGNFDYMKFFNVFDNLKKLAIRRECITGYCLLQMVDRNLCELALYGDSESVDIPVPNDEPFNDQIWNKILTKRPTFLVDLEIKHLPVALGDFPCCMPLRNIGLTFFKTDLELIDLLKHFTKCYSKTLVYLSFVFDDSEEDGGFDFDEQFRGLSFGLLELVRACTKLSYLRYNMPINSGTVLCIAKERKMQELCLYENKVSYIIENDMSSHNMKVEWLKECGYNQSKLEDTVSSICYKGWHLLPDEEYEILNH